MKDSCWAKIYEKEDIRSLFGESLNPGGLALTGRAVDYCKFQPGTKILDVGCGIGSTVHYLRTNYKLDAIGIDASEKLISLGLEKYPDLPIYSAEAENIPYSDQSMQAIISECVLPYFEDANIVLQEFRRILEPKGRLILSNLYFNRKENEMPDKIRNNYDKQKRIMFRQDIKLLLERHGFTVQLWEDHSNLLIQFLCDVIMKGGNLQKMPISCCKDRKLGYYLLIAQKNRESGK